MKKYSGSILIVDDDEHVLLTSRMILKQYFERYHTMNMENFKVGADEIEDDGRGKVVVQECKGRREKTL